ncbi:MAG: acetyltransferase [Beijerinckiaceae bacterium]
MKRIFAVYGASGCGRGIMPLVRDQIDPASETCCFIDDGRATDRVNGELVYRFDEFLTLEGVEKAVCIAIANPVIRAAISAKCTQAGLAFFSARARNLVIMDDVIIGEGALLSPFVTITSNIRIGRHLHANLYSYIEHDTVIGDFVTLAPGAKINGNITIEDFAYIGSNAVIKQGVPGKPLVIGKGATIGMGAVVTRSVPPGVTVVGNPARPLVKPAATVARA